MALLPLPLRRVLPLALMGLVASACGSKAPPPPGAPEPPGTSPTDAGTPPGQDAGTPAGADGGVPVPDGGTPSGGAPDAGTPRPGADGGTPDAGTPGPGADGGTSGGGDGGTAFDPASYDPRFAVTRSDAPACAGIGPGPVPTPARQVFSNPSNTHDCWGPEVSDGQGDIGTRCYAWSADVGWFDLHPLRGPLGQLNANQLVPFIDGFGAAYTPQGPRAMQLNFAWFDGADWHTSSAPQAEQTLVRLIGAGARALVLRQGPGGAPLSLQDYDAHGNPLGPPRAWPGTGFGYAGVDARGYVLITWSTAPGGGLTGQWLTPEGAPLGAAFDAPPPPDDSATLEPLANGGFVLGRAAVLPEGQPPAPVPSWLAARPQPFVLVNGGRAYAFFKPDAEPPGQPCAPTVTVVAPDGTACGTVSLLFGTNTCPQPARVGIDGTLMQSWATGRRDHFGATVYVWRWWPRLFP